MKMVKEDIVNREARKSIKKSAYLRGKGCTGKASYIKVTRKGGTGKFKYKQRPHKIGKKIGRERNSKPEKRTA